VSVGQFTYSRMFSEW